MLPLSKTIIYGARSIREVVMKLTQTYTTHNDQKTSYSQTCHPESHSNHAMGKTMPNFGEGKTVGGKMGKTHRENEVYYWRNLSGWWLSPYPSEQYETQL